MVSKFYMPILRTKEGEFLALSQLKLDIQGYVVPLIEVADKEFDNEKNKEPKTIEDHLDTVAKRILKKWPRSNAFLYCDLVSHQSPNGITSVEYIYTRLSQAIALPSPAIRLTTPDEIKTAFRQVMVDKNLSEIAIRIFISDLMTEDLAKQLEALLNFFSLPQRNTHIVLDLENADFSKIDDFAESILDHLQTFPDFNQWKSFSVCGGSFPKSQQLTVGENIIPRGEWLFYKKLMELMTEASTTRHVNYGDYGIIAPGHFVFDKRKDRSANIRYTFNDEWYVVKGKSIKINGYEQYIDLAKKIVKSDYYMKENFSAGDKHLKETTLKGAKPGSMTVWKKVGFNHHITKVMADLNAMYLAV